MALQAMACLLSVYFHGASYEKIRPSHTRSDPSGCRLCHSGSLLFSLLRSHGRLPESQASPIEEDPTGTCQEPRGASAGISPQEGGVDLRTGLCHQGDRLPPGPGELPGGLDPVSGERRENRRSLRRQGPGALGEKIRGRDPLLLLPGAYGAEETQHRGPGGLPPGLSEGGQGRLRLPEIQRGDYL